MTLEVTLRNDCWGGQMYVFRTMNSLRMSFWMVTLSSDSTNDLLVEEEESPPPSFAVFAPLWP